VSGGKTLQTRDASSAHGAASGRLIAIFRRAGSPSSIVCTCEFLSPSRPAQLEEKVPFDDIVPSEENVPFEEKVHFAGEGEC
jgi:hypothetical protein